MQYLSIQYTERLAEAGIEPSVGSRGDAYDNALAESVIDLYKTEVIIQHGPWKSLEEVGFKTLEWVDWFNDRRLLKSRGYVPRPSTRRCTIGNRRLRLWWPESSNSVSGIPGAIHSSLLSAAGLAASRHEFRRSTGSHVLQVPGFTPRHQRGRP